MLPELRPVDERLWQAPVSTATRTRDRDLPGSRNSVRDATRNMASSRLRNGLSSRNRTVSGLNGLNFGLSDDVLATLIAQPDLNNLIGPQGINDIINGVPPILLPPEAPSHTRAPIAAPRTALRDVHDHRHGRPDPRVMFRSASSHLDGGGIPVSLDLLDTSFDVTATLPRTDPTIGSLLTSAERLSLQSQAGKHK